MTGGGNVGNKAVMRNLTIRQFRMNRMRNLFAGLAILLTTLLITVIFTVGISLIDGVREMMFQSLGRDCHVSFQYLTDDEAEKVAAHPLIQEYGLSRLVAATSDGIFSQNYGEIRSNDETFAGFTYSLPRQGRLPEKHGETAVMSWILEAMGLPQETGQRITIDFQLGEASHSLELEVCGIWESNFNLNPYGWVLISQEQADELLAGIDVAASRELGSYNGILQLYANLAGSVSQLESSTETILQDTGLSADEILPLVNQAYTSAEIELEVLLPVILILSIIMLSGYLLIYNVFYISIMRDIRFYGLLKMLGTTKGQIRRFVLLQALFLSVTAIPAGLILGFFFGKLLIPLLLSFLFIDYAPAALNPLIFVFAASLSGFTVIISCWKPASFAGKSSPIEAFNYTGLRDESKKTQKKSTGGAKLGRMSFSNLLRNKKKTAVTIASITLGLMLFQTVFTYVNSYDVNKYLTHYIHGDFLLADQSYFNLVGHYTPTYTLSEEVLAEIEELPGVNKILKIYYENGRDEIRPERIPEEADYKPGVQIYGFDDDWLWKLEENTVFGTFDKERYLTGDYALIGFDYENLFQPGDFARIRLRPDTAPAADSGQSVTGSGPQENSPQETSDIAEYEVMARIDTGPLFALSSHYSTSPGYSIYLPASEMRQKYPGGNIMSATVLADEESLEDLQAQIAEMLKEHPDLDFRSRSDYIREMETENMQTAVIGFTLCSVIFLIGILNFANTIMTGIIARRQEIAILQSIGMTDKECRKMLTLESLWHIAIVFLLLITAGTAVTTFVVGSIAESSAAYTLTPSLLPTALCFTFLLLVSCLLPQAVFRQISKESVVDRLHRAE